jgi:hypothetical protein
MNRVNKDPAHMKFILEANAKYTAMRKVKFQIIHAVKMKCW